MKKVLVAVCSRRDVVTIASMKMLGKMFLIALIGIAITADYAHAQMTQKQILGTWSVVSAIYEVDGKKSEIFGPNPLGQFIFTADGHFSLTVMRSDRPRFASNNSTTGTPEENKAAMAGFIHLYGTYTFSSDGWQTLHIEGSSFPNWNGAEQRRRIQVKGDDMTYVNPTPPTGSGTITLTLKRAKKS